jgi:nitrogen fixation NifU-like protein
MDLYRENILDHYRHPRNFGSLEEPDKTAESYNATCGDRIRFEININDTFHIEELRFSGSGCAVSIAAASMLSEEIKGKKIRDVMKIKGKHMTGLIGSKLTPSRVKCATLPLEVLQKALVK